MLRWKISFTWSGSQAPGSSSSWTEIPLTRAMSWRALPTQSAWPGLRTATTPATSSSACSIDLCSSEAMWRIPHRQVPEGDVHPPHFAIDAVERGHRQQAAEQVSGVALEALHERPKAFRRHEFIDPGEQLVLFLEIVGDGPGAEMQLGGNAPDRGGRIPSRAIISVAFSAMVRFRSS